MTSFLGKRKESGSVLILVLAVLTVLSLLAVTLLIITGLETDATVNYGDLVKAQMIAESGVNSAIAEKIQEAKNYSFEAAWYDSMAIMPGYYREEFIDANGDGYYSKETDSLILDRNGNTGYDPYLPVDDTPTPSYQAQDTLIANQIGIVSGNDPSTYKVVGISGGNYNEFYTTKVLDCASQIYINGPCTIAPNVLDDNVVGMLNTLGYILNKAASKYDIADSSNEDVAISQLGYLIGYMRYDGPFFNEYDLTDQARFERAKDANNPFENKLTMERPLNELEYKILKDYITCYMWVDYSTLNPGYMVPFKAEDNPINYTPYARFDKDINNTGIRKEEDVISFNTGNEDFFSVDKWFKGYTPSFKESVPAILYGFCYSTITVPADPGGGGSGNPTYDTTTRTESTVERSRDLTYTNHLMAQESTDDTQAEATKPSSDSSIKDYVVQPRAPICLNTAPREVLISVLYPMFGGDTDVDNNGLQAYAIRRGSESELGDDARTFVAPGEGYEISISLNQVFKVVEALMTRRREAPFRNWSEFNRYIDNELPDDIGLSVHQKQIIKANANPNSNLYDFNPDRNLGGSLTSLDYTLTDEESVQQRFPYAIDKNNLLRWSTEFCFNSMGYYEIESIGRVCEDIDNDVKDEIKDNSTQINKNVLSERKISSVVCLYDVYKHNSQRDFADASVQNILGTLTKVDSAPSFENTASFPENMTNLSGSVEDFPDYPSRIDPQIQAELAKSGETTSVPDDSYKSGAQFDGYIAVHTKMDENSQPSPMIFKAEYDAGLVAEGAKTGAGNLKRVDNEGTTVENRSIADNYFEDSYEESEFGVKKEGDLYLLTQSLLSPDGVRCNETYRYPYLATDNVITNDSYLRYKNGVESGISEIGETSTDPNPDNGYIRPGQGVLAMWVKPAHDLEEQMDVEAGLESDNDSRVFFSMGKGLSSNTATITVQEVSETIYSDTTTTVTGGSGSGDMLAYELYRNWPDATWYTRTITIAGSGGGGGGGTTSSSTEIGTTNRTDVLQNDAFNEFYRVLRQRVVFYTRNRELDLFFGANVDLFNLGFNDQAEFQKAAVSLDESPWKWRAGTWHYIAFKWNDDDNQNVKVYVDGKASTLDYQPFGSLIRLPENSLFVGNLRAATNVSNGNPCEADSTIADFVVYSNAWADDSGLRIPDRYDSSYKPYDEYYYEATLADFTDYLQKNDQLNAVIGTVSWTEYSPISSEGGDVKVELVAKGIKYPENSSDLDGEDSQSYSIDEIKLPEEDGTGIPVNKKLSLTKNDTEKTLRYKIMFKLPDSPPNLLGVVETPIVDDIMVTLITGPREIARWEDPLLNPMEGTRYNGGKGNLIDVVPKANMAKHIGKGVPGAGTVAGGGTPGGFPGTTDLTGGNGDGGLGGGGTGDNPGDLVDGNPGDGDGNGNGDGSGLDDGGLDGDDDGDGGLGGGGGISFGGNGNANRQNPQQYNQNPLLYPNGQGGVTGPPAPPVILPPQIPPGGGGPIVGPPPQPIWPPVIPPPPPPPPPVHN